MRRDELGQVVHVFLSGDNAEGVSTTLFVSLALLLFETRYTTHPLSDIQPRTYRDRCGATTIVGTLFQASFP